MLIIKLKIIYIKYPTITIEKREASKIRGFFGSNFTENIEMHNHLGDKFLYSYPKIQYKVLYNTPLILGIEDAIPSLHKSIMNTKEILIGNIKYPCDDIDIKLETKYVNILNCINKYKFLTPWISLNQKNHKIYKELSLEDRKIFLDKILVGNILSMCKGLDIHIKENIFVDTNLEETYIVFKNTKMMGFYGNFKTNFSIPNYFGIGKSVSRGFGMIKEIKEEL